jgi:malate dehydrogenase
MVKAAGTNRREGVRIAIVGGGGGVGASVAFNLLLGPGEHEILLVDRRREMVLSHALDLEQVLEQGATGWVREGRAEDVRAADIVVVTAAAPLTVNDSRMVYLEANARILEDVAELVPPSWSGILLVVTNPVDPLCTWVQRRTGIDRRRVLGYTLNDSLRLRTGVGRALGVDAGRVEAWAIGEHGDHAVLLWDRITVDGSPVRLSDAQRKAAEQFVRGWYRRHVALDSGRSSTWTSGLGVARMVRALADDAHVPVWPASVALSGEYGIDGVSLSVPVTLGPSGAEEIHEWPLSGEARSGLSEGAEFVRDAADRLARSQASSSG